MAVTLMKSTIHRSLHAFDEELGRRVKTLPATRNAVIVSLPLESAINYMYASKGTPIPRNVLVTADEEKRLLISFYQEGVVLTTLGVVFPFITHYNDAVLDFLIDGISPIVETAQ